MIQFIRKRLQVFISSTYTDLIMERQSAVEAILTAGHIPAGMELFTSGDESQMDAIKQWIDESDVYLLILGGRYGSIEPTSGKSYTQLEYEYAMNEGKPLFACCISDSALDAKIKSQGAEVLEKENPHKLKEFRSLVLTKMVKFWEDSKDIKISVGETLAQFSRKNELIGWIRADNEANMPALVDEIARLSKENSILRSQIINQDNSSILGIDYLQLKQLLESKDILEIFKDKDLVLRLNSREGEWSSVEKDEKMKELSRIGLLVEYDYSRFKLTDEGKEFLNKFEFDLINGDKN